MVSAEAERRDARPVTRREGRASGTRFSSANEAPEGELHLLPGGGAQRPARGLQGGPRVDLEAHRLVIDVPLLHEHGEDVPSQPREVEPAANYYLHYLPAS